MAKVTLTEEEIISYIKKSSLINILVEGPDDLMVYNHIEDQIRNFKYSIFPCHGRSVLIEIYKRKAEFADKKVIFVADKDVWAFNGIPEEYSEVIFTSGYSIENDLFDYGHSLLFTLMRKEEIDDFNEVLENLIKWYCSEISKYIKGGVAEISCHLNKIIPFESKSICQEFLKTYNFENFDNQLLIEVKSNNYLKLRGKFLFHAALRYLSSSKRRSKYSYENLLELCLTLENRHFDRIISEILLKSA